MAAMQFCFSEVCGFFSELRVLQFIWELCTQYNSNPLQQQDGTIRTQFT
jgi:hypothetical protein